MEEDDIAMQKDLETMVLVLNRIDSLDQNILAICKLREAAKGIIFIDDDVQRQEMLAIIMIAIIYIEKLENFKK